MLIKATVASKNAGEVKPVTERKTVAEVDTLRIINAGRKKEAELQQGAEVKHVSKAG